MDLPIGGLLTVNYTPRHFSAPTWGLKKHEQEKLGVVSFCTKIEKSRRINQCPQKTIGTGVVMTQHFRISVCLLLLFSGLLGTSLLALDAAVLTAPKRIFSGSESSFTLTTFDSKTRVPINRNVLVQLVNSQNVVVSELFSGATGSEGRVTNRFSIPSDLAGTFRIIASVQGLNESLQLTAEVDRSPALLIETDKPIYKPGQIMMGRVVLLNAALQPQSGEVEIAIHDAKGIRVGKFQSAVGEYGIAAFQLPLASELNHGTWKVRAESGGSRSVRDIRVEPYTLPRFELITSFPKSWALVDEAISGTIEATYFFGKPVSGAVQISAQRWIGVWEEYSRVENNLTEGTLDFSLPAVGYVAGTLDEKGQGTVLLEIEVTDSVGNTQKTTETLTISSASAVLALIPSTESLKPGMPANVFLQSTQPDGVPVNLFADIELRYLASDQSVISTEDRALETSEGIAEFDFTAPERTQYVEIAAEAEYGGYSTTTSRRIGGAYSPSGSFISLVRLGEDSLTVGQVARFSVQSSASGTVYYEVYAGGRTILSDATEFDSFDFTVTQEMVPKANVVAYMISPFSEVAADRISIPVALPITLTIDADFDLAQVRPGDPVEVEIDTGTGRTTMLGVSIVDESLLALGNGRLHLAEVFDELEERFLEPQIEVHDGGGDPEPGPFFPGLMPPVHTTGSKDVFDETGLGIVASPGINIPQGSGIFDAGAPVISPPVGGEAGQTAPDAPRVREFFPETWVWNPMLLTDDEGKARLTLTAPDSITGWKLAVVSTCPRESSNQPGIGFGEGELTVFQEFFVEPAIPFSVIRGEDFSLRVDVFNYLDEDQVVELSLADTDGIEFADSKGISLTVPANSALPASFSVNPVEVGEFPVTITAIGGSLSDAVKRPITVVPEGLPAEQILNDVIESGQVHQLNLRPPPRTVEDSARTFLFISPSPVAQSMNGVSDLLGMPYGCGEQNMIFLAPDIEILKYLREIGELAPEVRAEAENFINLGYQRQLTFQTDDGGFAAFGGEQGSLWLTAFVLSTFASAREVRDIDESVLTASAEMLVSRQKTDGSFETDDFLIHKEMDGGLENLYAMTAYVANALADYGSDDFSDALQKAAGYLASRTTDVWEDAYSLAIAAVALQKIEGYGDLAEALLDRLLELAISEGTGIHWEPYPVETTGYAASALLSSGETGRPESQSAIDWLSTQRNSLGGYGSSTQDTVVALHALFQAAQNANRDLDVDLSLWSGSDLLYEVHLDQANYDVLQQFEVPKDRTAFELRSVGVGTVAYQWVERFNLPGEFLPPSKNLIFEVEYSTDHVEIDDIVDVRAMIRYSGLKEITGMVILDIGVPTGFEPVLASLDKL
ncbi:MAG TPA: alpha-2-macroglobulin family protein, partial [Acidobacteriota bacterium]|nr:alpha-2-macroglobulin family protein [Acidobacteriota bacterium]